MRGGAGCARVNRLYYGDNLHVLREQIPEASVDLVYLDPPFNSNATYNVLFRASTGEQSQAQIEAFDDTWHWNEPAEDAYWQVLKGTSSDAARMLEAMRGFLGQNDMMAYLAMMAVRLIELHRVLKPTGSLYLHCDPTASHYLKILLDATFEPRTFRSEIIWRRTSAHANSKRNFAGVHDVILLFSKSARFAHNESFTAYSQAYIDEHFVHLDADGRRFRRSDLRNPGVRPNLRYKYTASNGITYQPHPNGWAVSREVMERLDREGRLFFPKKEEARLRKKIYLDESLGVPATDIWIDLPPIHASAEERLGYPTQKPVALLERIIAASSNEGDVVLDPFCGCGTTIHAAEKLRRQWIGIDVTHLAIALIERRLREAFPGIAYEVIGVPRDFGSAEALAGRDKHEFQKWAITLIPDAQPWKGGQKGADTGIDGIVYLRTGKSKTDKAIVEVKGGETVGVDFVHKLKSVIEREKALCGLLLSLRSPSRQAVSEAASAGFAEIDMGAGSARFPRIQLLGIEGLLAGTEHPRLPIVDSSVFKKARREDRVAQGEFGI